MLHSALKRVLLWTAPSRKIGGIPVTITSRDTNQQERVYATVAAALALLEQFDPRGRRAVGRYIRGILVAWAPHVRGSWFAPLNLCELSLEYVSQATPSQVASTILHEAVHARLERLGIRYNEPLRYRLELVCTHRQIDFVQKLPDGAMLLDELYQTLYQAPSFWSEAELHKARVRALHTLGAPRWFVSVAEFIHKWRAA